jgi:hypothetical protein
MIIKTLCLITVLFLTSYVEAHASDKKHNELSDQQRIENIAKKRASIIAEYQIYSPDKLAKAAFSENSKESEYARLAIKINGGKGDTRAFEIILNLAKEGDVVAQRTIANMANDIKHGLPWFELAAAQGDALSQMVLGRLYKEGEVVEKNYSKAFDMTYNATIGGAPTANFLLSGFYMEGIGVEQDLVKAYAWMNVNRCMTKPIRFHKKGAIASKLSEQEFEEAKELACKYYEEHVSTFISEEEKIKHQEFVDNLR